MWMFACYLVIQDRVVLAFHDITTMPSKKNASCLRMEAVVGTETISEMLQSVNEHVVSDTDKKTIEKLCTLWQCQ